MVNDETCWQKEHLLGRGYRTCSEVPSKYLHGKLQDLIVDSVEVMRKVECEDRQINHMDIEWLGGDIHRQIILCRYEREAERKGLEGLLAVPHYAQLLKGGQSPHPAIGNLVHVIEHPVRDDHDIFTRLNARVKHSINEELDRLEGQNIYLVWSQTLDKAFDLLVSVVVPDKMRIDRLLEVVVERFEVISASIQPGLLLTSLN